MFAFASVMANLCRVAAVACSFAAGLPEVHVYMEASAGNHVTSNSFRHATGTNFLSDSSRVVSSQGTALQASEPTVVNVDYDVPIHAAQGAEERLERSLKLEASVAAVGAHAGASFLASTQQAGPIANIRIAEPSSSARVIGEARRAFDVALLALETRQAVIEEHFSNMVALSGSIENGLAALSAQALAKES